MPEPTHFEPQPAQLQSNQDHAPPMQSDQPTANQADDHHTPANQEHARHTSFDESMSDQTRSDPLQLEASELEASELEASKQSGSTRATSGLSAIAHPIFKLWNTTASGIQHVLPINHLPIKLVTQWFSVSDEDVAEILDTVRRQLPTTEAILIGKPQSGKSSIIRGMTGVSSEIIGQGFRPHTQHTQRYAYPSDELPLLLFTDTIGLGDVNQDTQHIIDELLRELDETTQCARIFILTVKVNDFAIDTLRHIAQQLRKHSPEIPCLLAITCLHELYPADITNHPPYPPDIETIRQSSEAITTGFDGISDETIMIDFTLEEDGLEPMFYGLDALRDTLANLLPEAESKAIYRLLDEQNDASKQLGTLYRDVGRRYIATFSTMAATMAAVPLPFATMPVLTALQVSMIGVLGNLYGQKLTPSQAGGIVSAIAGGFIAQSIGRELIKFIPGFGSVVAASWAAAYTWALGESACVYFGELIGGKKPDPKRIQSVMASAFDSAKQRFKNGQAP